ADYTDGRRPVSGHGVVDLLGRIETEQEDQKDENDWRYAHGSSDHRQKIIRKSMATRTPSNGLETANQKETFQPVSSVVEVVFMLFFQASGARHFTKS